MRWKSKTALRWIKRVLGFMLRIILGLYRQKLEIAFALCIAFFVFAHFSPESVRIGKVADADPEFELRPIEEDGSSLRFKETCKFLKEKLPLLASSVLVAALVIAIGVILNRKDYVKIHRSHIDELTSLRERSMPKDSEKGKAQTETS